MRNFFLHEKANYIRARFAVDRPFPFNSARNLRMLFFQETFWSPEIFDDLIRTPIGFDVQHGGIIKGVKTFHPKNVFFAFDKLHHGQTNRIWTNWASAGKNPVTRHLSMTFLAD